MIAEVEAEKKHKDDQKVNDRVALVKAKKLDKEAHAAVKARLTQEWAVTSEAKKMERLRIVAEQKTEKARLAAKSRAKRAHAKVCMYSTNVRPLFIVFILEGTKWKAMSQAIEGVPEGEQYTLPPPTQVSTPMANKKELSDLSITQDKFLLHLNDPSNFSKLFTAICILLHCQLINSQIDHTDQLLREYCTELISVCAPITQIKMPGKLTVQQLYGFSVIKPNHHYLTHVSKCVQNYGLLHDFWTFLCE